MDAILIRSTKAARFTLRERNFKKVALFLRLGPPFTLIHHESEAFRKRSSKRINLKKSASRFHLDGAHFENGAFRKHTSDEVLVVLKWFRSTLTSYSSSPW